MELTKIMEACTNEHLSNFESISNRSPVCALENFKEPFNTTNLLLIIGNKLVKHQLFLNTPVLLQNVLRRHKTC